jgi:2-phosphosulfolactate phosphatase
MRIDIQLVPYPPKPELVSKHIVVVIDVLRATSVMVFAMSQGALEIIPVATVEEALQRAKTFPRRTTLLGGERESRKIEGFDLGNSPKEYTAERVKGKRLILTTTNGTKAFHSVSAAGEIMAGSFSNINATAERCVRLDGEIILFPSGDRGHFSLEDTVCAGMLVDRIMKNRKEPPALTDASQSAHILYKRFEANLLEVFHLSSHGRDLVHLGLGDDLSYCAQVDITNVVPVFKDGVIRVE